ncbi:MAG TPA: hypothetical protein VL984_03600 [Acidimicrobiales bacterium]|nr:hypothetical protein [Acidimicrobiales bacterium]
MSQWVVVQAVMVEPRRVLSNGAVLPRPSGLLAGWHIVNEDEDGDSAGLCGRSFHPGIGRKAITEWEGLPGVFKCRQCDALWAHVAS